MNERCNIILKEAKLTLLESGFKQVSNNIINKSHLQNYLQMASKFFSMKYFFIIFNLFTLYNVGSAQSLIIDYDYEVNKKHAISTIKQTYQLYLDNDKSLFKPSVKKPEDLLYYNKDINVNFRKGDAASVIFPDGSQSILIIDKYFKDYSNDSVLYNRLLINRIKLISEKLSDLFEWEIIDKADTLILNYPCKTAKTKFRGRDYIAHFTTTTGHTGGPWKFDGLPGLILSIYSIDGYFNINATQIKEADKEFPENPYKNKKKAISFDDFTKEFKEKWTNRLKRSVSGGSEDDSGQIRMEINDVIEYMGFDEIVVFY